MPTMDPENVIDYSSVEDGAEALNLVFHCDRYVKGKAIHYPGLVLLDLKLPKLNGFEVLRVLKEAKRTSSIPVFIAMSSKEVPDIKAAFQLSANSDAVKPVDFDAFMEAICSLGLYWQPGNRAPVSN